MIPNWCNLVLDFCWKKKWKFIRSLRRRGFDYRLVPRVPSAGVTGSVGKTTTCRMVAHILATTGRTVALTTTQGMYVGRDLIRSGDLAGGEYAGRLLLDPRVQAGVFELARGGLISDGMFLSAVDVGAVLNVFDNHIGLNGVDDREGLARVKSVVVRKARRLAVLNADDPLCLGMAGSVSVPVCLVSMRADNPEILRHCAGGGLAACLGGPEDAPVLRLLSGGSEIGSMGSAEIPAAWGGVFRPAVSNALFAAAIAHGLGVGWRDIRNGLAGFHSDRVSNPGRMNFLSGFPFRVVLTWVDGPQAMGELSRFAGRASGVGRKHLMLCAMGNRPEWFLLETARAAAGAFDTFICSDWENLRGRQPGETARLLARGLLESGLPVDAVTVAPTHQDALSMALNGPQPGDMLVLVTFSGEQALAAADVFRMKGSPGKGESEERI